MGAQPSLLVRHTTCTCLRSVGLGRGLVDVVVRLGNLRCQLAEVLGEAGAVFSLELLEALDVALDDLGLSLKVVAHLLGIRIGKVVDFLNYGWSVGNVADIYLVVAGVALVILILMGEPFSHKDLIEQSDESLQSEPEADDK